jgi:hypothetical protein
MRPSFLDRLLSLVLGLHLIKFIEPGTAILALGGANLLGSLIGGNATAKAQAAANASNERIANQTNQYNQNQYLLGRGFSTGSMPGLPVGDVNTVLPLWAEIQRMPAEQYLFNSIISTGLGNRVDTANPLSFASVNQTRAYLAANPQRRTEIEDMLKATGDARDAATWLRDHITTTETDDGGGWLTEELRKFGEQSNAAQGDPNALPAEWRGLLDQSRGAIGKIYSGEYLTEEMNALAPALAARLRLGDIELERNNELRGKTKNIYDAELLRADTYADSAMEAVRRVMAQQDAKNAVRGFSGGSAMDDLTRARATAGAIQQGAGARAQAGVDYATRLAQILDADASKITANAEIQNALDRLGITSNDINRRIGNVGTAGSLFQQELGLKDLVAGERFRDLDATLKRLGMLTTGGAVQAAPYVAPNVQPVLTSGQIAGSAISSLAGMGMDYFTNQALIGAINKSPSLFSSAAGYGRGGGGGALFSPSGNFNYTVGNFATTPAG